MLTKTEMPPGFAETLYMYKRIISTFIKKTIDKTIQGATYKQLHVAIYSITVKALIKHDFYLI